MIPAIFVNDKIFTGSHHGEAFSKLNDDEKISNLRSGFIDNKHLKFITDTETIYLKEIIIIRHAQSNTNIDDGPLTTMGTIQAQRLAVFLKTLHLDDYEGFCSPYIRCQQTSDIINANCTFCFNKNPNFRKQDKNESYQDFLNRVILTLDFLPQKSVLITHCDFIQNILQITKLKENLNTIENCSITYINHNKLIWFAKDIND